MTEEIVRYHKIDGVIGSNEKDIDLLMAFVEWLEERGAEFGGSIGEIDEDGNHIGDMRGG